MQFNIKTQYPVIRDEDILKMPIPKIPKGIQLEITQKIQLSQSLKKQSEQLLEAAKRAVEIAIEEGERNVLRMIEEFNS
jgi:type I restriction enzyme S subunit